MEGSGKSGPAGSRACSADPDSQPPIINSGMTAEFRVESLTCPHSRTRPAPLTDFNWPRPLPPTADHPRQEDRVTSAGASRTRTVRTGSPALYQLTYEACKHSHHVLVCVYIVPYETGRPAQLPAGKEQLWLEAFGALQCRASDGSKRAKHERIEAEFKAPASERG